MPMKSEKSKTASDGISFAEAQPIYAKQSGHFSKPSCRQWLRVNAIPRLPKSGCRVLFDRAAFMRVLLEKHPKTPEQEQQILKAALQAVQKNEPIRCEPLRPLPDAHIAKVNLMSWAVAAQLGHSRNLANCPVHLADERRRQACLFSNFIRCAVAPCVAGILYDGQDAETKVHEMADTLKGYANGQCDAPQSPTWLIRAQEKITLIAASVGMELDRPTAFDVAGPGIATPESSLPLERRAA